MSKCNSRLIKSLKKSLDQTKARNWARHLRGPIGTIGVLIGITSRPDLEMI